MKRSISIVVFSFLLYSNAFSQWFFVDGFDYDSYRGFISVKFWDSNFGLVVGRDGIMLKTNDGGLNWENIETPTKHDLYDINYLNKDTIIVVASSSWSSAVNTGGVLFSYDGGNNWIIKYESANELKSVSLSPSKEIFACGNKGIIKSKDHGNIWTIEAGGYFDEIFCVDNSNIIALSKQYIYLRDSTSITWTKLNNPLLDNRWDKTIDFVDDKIGWIASGYNIYKTNDGGKNWNFIKELGAQITSLSFVNDTLGFACGYGSSIFKTNDGGYNWERFIIPDALPYRALFSIQMFDSLAGICIGMNIILKTENGGGTVTNIKTDQNVLNIYRLSQNYPNPFNPTTKIKYSIPSNSKSETASVKLVVYNVLGKEVATLVNKVQPAGNYEVEFNANNLTSGIYFYRLQAGSFVESKKMILIK